MNRAIKASDTMAKLTWAKDVEDMHHHLLWGYLSQLSLHIHVISPLLACAAYCILVSCLLSPSCLRVLTTNHARDNANREAKCSGRGDLATLTVYGSVLYQNMLDLTIPARNLYAVATSSLKHTGHEDLSAALRPRKVGGGFATLTAYSTRT